jgi:hypothetical protein
MALQLVGDRVLTETGFLQDRDRLREVAEGFQPGDSGGLALVPSLRKTVRQLAARREVNACVLVFSDHPAVHYATFVPEIERGGTANPGIAFRNELEGGQVKLILIDEQTPAGVNLAVEQVRFEPGQVHVGASSRATAVVRNHTDQEQTTNVRFYEGDQAGQQRPLTLGPREAASIDLVHRFEAPLDSPCRVEIDADVLPADNRFYLPMRIRERRQVLLVAPPSPAAEERTLELSNRAVDLLAYALNPGEALGRQGTAIQVKRISPPQLGRVSLPIYSLIILQGVVDLPEQAGRDLLAFVRNGGAVWIIPERDVSPLRFNEALRPLLAGLEIGQLKLPDPVQGIDHSEAAIGHPLFVPLLREEWGRLADLTFSQYFGLHNPASATVALRATGGDPLFVVLRQERGLVLLQLFPGGLDASTLPRTPAYVPMVQQAVALAAGRVQPNRPDVMRVGEVHRLDVPEFRSLKGEVRLVQEGAAKQTLRGGETGEVRVGDLTRAGSYKVVHTARPSDRPRWLAVNPVLGASDLTALTEADQEKLFGSHRVVRLPYAEVGAQFQRRHEMLPWLLVLVAVAFAVEALVGAWQSRRRIRPTAAGGAA